MNAMTVKADGIKLATRMNGVGLELIRAAIAMPLTCNLEQVTSVETAAPGLFEFEREEEARRIREKEESLQFEREAMRYPRD